MRARDRRQASRLPPQALAMPGFSTDAAPLPRRRASRRRRAPLPPARPRGPETRRSASPHPHGPNRCDSAGARAGVAAEQRSRGRAPRPCLPAAYGEPLPRRRQRPRAARTRSTARDRHRAAADGLLRARARSVAHARPSARILAELGPWRYLRIMAIVAPKLRVGRVKTGEIHAQKRARVAGSGQGYLMRSRITAAGGFSLPAKLVVRGGVSTRRR